LAAIPLWGIAEGAMEKAPSYKTLFASMNEPLTPAVGDEVFPCPPQDELRRLMFIRFVHEGYKDKWKWGAAAQHLYRALIRALGLEHYEDELMALAEPKRGRKKEVELAARIRELKVEGKTVPQIKATFESEGKHYSTEMIESYLKTRRRRD
jgi:hypothetical protein